ncbi:MAG TPA: glycosyltransferase family 4 protein [Polyangiaceae bacterium]|nr:glycosyltransferase family 4 protein [Polyangiaceae bacterium]
MRLVLVTQDFPPLRGGIQTYAAELAARLAPRCEAFTVLAPRAPGGEESDRALGFRVLRQGTFDTLITASAPVLGRLALREGFEHSFHVQWSTAPAALALRRARQLESVTVAAHGRELLLEPWRRLGFAQRAYDAVRRHALTQADRVLAVSRYTAGLAEGLGVLPERVTVTHNGTDPSRFRAVDTSALRAQLRLGSRPVLVTLARLVARKGIDSVLRALPAVRRRVPDVAYVVVGEGPDDQRLRELARANHVADIVHFAGGVTDEARPLWYSLGDVFVMPARSEPPDVEGFGIVYLEAGACERPVVALRAGGVPDAVADGISGYLVTPGELDELADRLATLLLDPAHAAQLGKNARERVLGELTWDRVADRVFSAISAFAPPPVTKARAAPR